MTAARAFLRLSEIMTVVGLPQEGIRKMPCTGLRRHWFSSSSASMPSQSPETGTSCRWYILASSIRLAKV